MLTTPLVSVIIPTYNTAEYLPRCLDSVINQTLKDIEIIIISDGPEADHKICDEYAAKDGRIRVIKNIGKGLGGARNAGMAVARGLWIHFLDADDYIITDTYEKLLKTAPEDSDCIIFGTSVIGPGFLDIRKQDQDYLDQKFEGYFAINENIIDNVNVSAWNKLFKKNEIIKNKAHFPESCPLEDFPFYFYFMKMTKKVFITKTPYHFYYRRADSCMARTTEKKYDDVKYHILNCAFLWQLLSKEREKIPFVELYFSRIFKNYILIALRYSQNDDKAKIIQLSKQIFAETGIDIKKYPFLQTILGA